MNPKNRPVSRGWPEIFVAVRLATKEMANITVVASVAAATRCERLGSQVSCRLSNQSSETPASAMVVASHRSPASWAPRSRSSSMRGRARAWSRAARNSRSRIGAPETSRDCTSSARRRNSDSIRGEASSPRRSGSRVSTAVVRASPKPGCDARYCRTSWLSSGSTRKATSHSMAPCSAA